MSFSSIVNRRSFLISGWAREWRETLLGERSYVLLLVFVFLLSFSLPVFFAVRFLKARSAPVVEEVAQGDAVFAESTRIGGAGQFLEIERSVALSPEAGQDFLLVSWIKFLRLPDPGARVEVVARVDNSRGLRPGFSLDLIAEPGPGDSRAVRPQVYWKNAEGEGGAYTFSELEIPPRSWAMFGLSYTEGKFLGLHVALLNEGEDKVAIKLLGGYPLERPVLPQPNVGLRVGAVGKGAFRGLIGPLAILSRAQFDQPLARLVKEIAKAKLKIDRVVPADSIRLLVTDGATDRGPDHIDVRFVKPDRSGQNTAKAP